MTYTRLWEDYIGRSWLIICVQLILFPLSLLYLSPESEFETSRQRTTMLLLSSTRDFRRSYLLCQHFTPSPYLSYFSFEKGSYFPLSPSDLYTFTSLFYFNHYLRVPQLDQSTCKIYFNVYTEQWIYRNEWWKNEYGRSLYDTGYIGSSADSIELGRLGGCIRGGYFKFLTIISFYSFYTANPSPLSLVSWPPWI